MKPNGNDGNTTTKIQEKKPKTLKDFLLNQEGLIKTALPNNMNSERFTRLILLNVNQNPTLAQCDPMSILAAAMQSAQLGLEPGGTLGQAYLIPYKGKATFQIGYKGMIELCRRSGAIDSIMANAVHENDDFEYEYGLNETLSHKPSLKNRGDITCFYAYAKLKDGGHAFTVMSYEDIEDHAKKFSQAYNKSSSPWQTDFEAMAKKTVVKQLLKYLPVSVELLKNVASDGAIREEIDPDMADLSAEFVNMSDGINQDGE